MTRSRASRDDADLVFLGGSVLVPKTPEGPVVRALAVRAGRVAFVGTDDEVASMAGPHTEVVELGGRMVLPGFQDSHIHPSSGAVKLATCDLYGGRSIEEYVATIRRFAEERPTAAWIVGSGFAHEILAGATDPKGILDRVVPDRPVFLNSYDFHEAWVNSAALAMADIGKTTVDPTNGSILRRPDGEPNGVLAEYAQEAVRALAPTVGVEEMTELLWAAQNHLHGLGITAVRDAGIPLDPSDPTLEAYRRLASSERLSMRVIGDLWWDPHAGDDQLEAALAVRDQGARGRFSPIGIKIAQDGTAQSMTAALLEPYLDPSGHPTDHRGDSIFEPAELTRLVTRLEREGFPVHVHACGDRSVREALDAFEGARGENGPLDLRHQIAHLNLVHPDDLDRFAGLEVVADCQPLWAQKGPYTMEVCVPLTGIERAFGQFPIRSLKEAGARLAFGSDWPVTSADPFEEIHVAVNRRAFPGQAHADTRIAREEPLDDAEALDLGEAIGAFTMGSAFANHLDGETGSIEVGKWADLIVIDRDPFSQPASEIYRCGVDLTFVEGTIVYARE